RAKLSDSYSEYKLALDIRNASRIARTCGRSYCTGGICASWTTFSHLRISLSTKLEHSRGVLDTDSTPRDASRSLTSGRAATRAISLAQASAMSRGMPAGPMNPTHEVTKYPGYFSPMAGTSGRDFSRLALATAMYLSLPACTCGPIRKTESNVRSTSPATPAMTDGPLPL